MRGIARLAKYYFDNYDKEGKNRALDVEAKLYKKMIDIDIEPKHLENLYYFKWGATF